MKRWYLLSIALFAGVSNCLCQNDSALHFNPVNPQIGQHITINGVLGDFLWGDSNSQLSLLDSVAVFLNKNPTIIVQLESHTDCRASAEYNRDLSQRRADTARKKILTRLIDTSQLPKAIGVGEDNPFLKKCNCDLSDYERKCTEAEHRLNRRTVLRVIAIKEK